MAMDDFGDWIDVPDDEGSGFEVIGSFGFGRQTKSA